MGVTASPACLLAVAALTVLVGMGDAFIVVTWGRCPNIPTKPDFQLNSYLGEWYSYENFDAPFQYGATCVTAKYTLNSDGSITVLNTGYRDWRVKIFGITVGERERMRAEGRAEIVDPNRPGGLKVQFGGQPDFGGGDEANYLIVDTDYDNYSLVYSCSQFGGLPLKIEFAWLLTRERGVRPSNLEQLEGMLTDYGVNVKYFKKVKHDDC